MRGASPGVSAGIGQGTLPTRRSRSRRLAVQDLATVRLAELRARQAEQGRSRVPPLMEFIPKVMPKFQAPAHLARLVDVFERAALGEPVRAVISAPPRHGKTETVLLSLCWLLRRDPSRLHAFCSYGAALSHSKSRKARQYADSAAVDIERAHGTAAEWRTTAGGGLLATGVGGPLTGQGVSGVLVIDDPVKNRAEAESPTYRQRVQDWFDSVAYTRLEPGAGCVVAMTRWHQDDLAGRLLATGAWEHIRLPALTDDGEALWPERYPAASLEDIRAAVGPYAWASLYQGDPRPREGVVFRDVRYAVAPQGLRLSYGVDLAYSARTRADWSVLVLMGERAGQYYVLDVVRRKCEAPDFARELALAAARRPGVAMRWYAAGPEAGVAQLVRSGRGPDGRAVRIPLVSMAPRGDKYLRAQPLAAAWNEGKVHICLDAQGNPPEWASDFVAELTEFTGTTRDMHDDQVDAAAAAFDALAPGLSGPVAVLPCALDLASLRRVAEAP